MQFYYWTFSNRELATFIWIGVLILALLFKAEIRESIVNLIKHFFGLKVFRIILILTLYVSSVVYILYKIKFWDIALLKDTVYWYCTVAIVLLVNINDAKDTGYFTKAIQENLKWTIVLEFIVNFYSFNFFIELFLIPIVTLLMIIRSYSEIISKDKRTIKFVSNVLSAIGLIALPIIIYKTFVYYGELLTLENLKELLLPLVLSILYLPFIYFTALYFSYEECFRLIEWMTKDNLSHRKILKKEILWNVHGNLFLLKHIRKKIYRLSPYNNDDDLKKCLKKYFKKIKRS